MKSRFKLRAGKPTKKFGTTFRSQLESKWASWFKAHKWQVVYEPSRLSYTGGSYLPDFLWKNPTLYVPDSKVTIPLNLSRVYIEVKPSKSIATKELVKAYPALHQMDALIVLSSPPPKVIEVPVEVLGYDITWIDDDFGYDYTNMFIGDNTKLSFSIHGLHSSGISYKLT